MMEMFKDESGKISSTRAQSIVFSFAAVGCGIIGLIMIFKKPTAWQGIVAMVTAFLSAATGTTITGQLKAASVAKSAISAPPPATPPKVGPK